MSARRSSVIFEPQPDSPLLVYTLVTELPAVALLYNSAIASWIFLLGIFAVSVWNGAGFYIEVFGRKWVAPHLLPRARLTIIRRFERELEALRKELAETRSAASGAPSPSTTHDMLPHHDDSHDHEHDPMSSGVSVTSDISGLEEASSEGSGSPIMIGASGHPLDLKEGFALDASAPAESRKDR